jgi:hypothetical protein
MIEKLVEINKECDLMSKNRAIDSVPFRVYLAAMELKVACLKMIKALDGEKDNTCG